VISASRHGTSSGDYDDGAGRNKILTNDPQALSSGRYFHEVTSASASGDGNRFNHGRRYNYDNDGREDAFISTLTNGRFFVAISAAVSSLTEFSSRIFRPAY
jgi:hypothetical protein